MKTTQFFAVAILSLSTSIALAVEPLEDELPQYEQTPTQNPAEQPQGRTAAIDQSFRYGKAFIESGLFKPAILHLEEVLAVLPEDADANYYMGLAHLGLEQHEAARQYLQQTIDADQDYYPAYEQLGLLLISTGETDAARTLANALGEKLQGCGEQCPDALVMAESTLRAALQAGQSGKIDPSRLLIDNREDAGQLYREAISLINHKEFAKAIEVLNRTRTEYGPHPDILTYQGYAYRQLHQYQQAIHHYSEALSVDPAHKPANEYLGELYVETGDMPKAALQLARLDALCPFSCYEYQELQRWISQAQ